MPLYDTLFIIHPDHASKAKELVDRFKRVVEESGGTVPHMEEWGLKEMTYWIQKQKRGYYVLLQHLSSAQGVQELERQMKLSDGVMRYMTVRSEKEASPKAPAGGGKPGDNEDGEKAEANKPPPQA